MANGLAPIPNQPVGNSHEWREWFFKLWESLGGSQGQILFTDLNFTGSNLDSIQTRIHNHLQGLQGGNVGGTEYYHLDATQYAHTNTYGSFSNTADQNLAAANTAYTVVFNTTDVSNNITRASNQFTIANAGTYNIQFSLQLANTDSQAHAAEIWLSLNGTNVAGTGSKYDVPSKHGSSDGYLIAVANFLVTVTAGQYIELKIAATQVENGVTDGVYIEAYAAQSSPYVRPSIPSSVITITPIG